jgi:urease accessory protein
MNRALHIAPSGQWPRDRATGSVTLAYDDRHRRRIRLATDQGGSFLLDLPQAAVLGEGDGLQLDDGAWIEVRAAPERLVEVTAPGPALLARLAWHLGNRHLAAQIEPGRILIRDDHVIVAMLQGLGAGVRHVTEPFTPEPGAYARDPGHRDHDHRHDHDH